MPPSQPPKRQVVAKRKAPAEPTKRSESQMAQSYRQVWKSPYVQDTLGMRTNDVLMAPIPLDSSLEGRDDTMAKYIPRLNMIFANVSKDPRMYPMAGAPPADVPSERGILTHEVGHVYGPQAFPSFPMRAAIAPNTQPKTALEREARAQLSAYGQTAPEEALAQAYVNATSFLSETAPDTTGFRQRIGALEANTPGMGGIVRDLLRGRPVYHQHPLRGVIR